jgi:hypothetical protein
MIIGTTSRRSTRQILNYLYDQGNGSSCYTYRATLPPASQGPLPPEADNNADLVTNVVVRGRVLSVGLDTKGGDPADQGTGGVDVRDQPDPAA